jgi:hypothetical protein
MAARQDVFARLREGVVEVQDSAESRARVILDFLKSSR